MTPENKFDSVFASIPRTKAEMDAIREQISRKQTGKLIEKAHRHNKKIERAKKLLRLFSDEDFIEWWNESVLETFKDYDQHSVSQIRGKPKDSPYDPFGQLVQLNQIIGAIEALAYVIDLKEKVAQEAKGTEVDIETLKAEFPENNE